MRKLGENRAKEIVFGNKHKLIVLRLKETVERVYAKRW